MINFAQMQVNIVEVSFKETLPEDRYILFVEEDFKYEGNRKFVSEGVILSHHKNITMT